MNGADLLCDTLLHNGVDVCFANPGTSEMHFVAALDRKPEMRCVLGLAETIVTGAADGYARMAEKPAATLLHLGPGLANGLANIHNARRAGTPMLNVVGDHASDHLIHDAPLTSDVAAVARPFSAWVGRAERADLVGVRTAEALAATRVGAWGRVSTMILPADTAWTDVPPNVAPVSAGYAPAPAPDPIAIEAVARALRSGKPGLILLGAGAMRAEALDLASRIAGHMGAALMLEGTVPRISRGAGRVAVARVPYPIDMALAALSRFAFVALVGARDPVAFFRYPGKPSRVLPEECEVLSLASREQDARVALRALADALGLPAAATPKHSPLALPDAPDGRITAETLAAAVSRQIPEGSIIVDEGITLGKAFFPLSQTARPHEYITLTGGAIGAGIPMATGAAIAAPGRKVINMQADGSGFYSLQGLWTQARERLDVVTIILANRSYATLRGELAKVGAARPGRNANRMIDLDDPTSKWTALARGFGVESARVETAEALDSTLASALRREGPFLIEAMFD